MHMRIDELFNGMANMEFSDQEKLNGSNECPQCGAHLLENALFCGKCGHSLTVTGDESSENHTPVITGRKSLWQWISGPIWLWIIILAINGILGLAGRFSDISSPYNDVLVQVVLAVVIIGMCAASAEQLKPLLNHFSYRGLLSVFEIIGAVVFIYIFMSLYLYLTTAIGFEQLTYLDDFYKHNWPLWSAFILICLLPGVMEELAFRGYIMSRLEKVGSAKEALILQAVMFSVLHMMPAIFISHFVIGLILGIIRLRSRSLYPGMIVHTGWNAIVLIEEIYRMGAIS